MGLEGKRRGDEEEKKVKRELERLDDEMSGKLMQPNEVIQGGSS
jgi:hypothetical protein